MEGYGLICIPVNGFALTGKNLGLALCESDQYELSQEDDNFISSWFHWLFNCTCDRLNERSLLFASHRGISAEIVRLAFLSQKECHSV